jgi:hypothetical protein
MDWLLAHLSGLIVVNLSMSLQINLEGLKVLEAWAISCSPWTKAHQALFRI